MRDFMFLITQIKVIEEDFSESQLWLEITTYQWQAMPKEPFMALLSSQ